MSWQAGACPLASCQPRIQRCARWGSHGWRLRAASSDSLATSLGIKTRTVKFLDGRKEEVFDAPLDLKVVSLKGSMPLHWETDMKLLLGPRVRVGMTQRDSLQNSYDGLSAEAKRAAKGERRRGVPSKERGPGQADAVTLGDAWLGPAIRGGLVRPIPDAQRCRWWRALGPRWHALVQRDANGYPDPKGQVYGAPYRWGCVALAFNRTQLRKIGVEQPRDWKDLLHPKLRGKVAFANSGRELLAIALRICGHSGNATAAQVAKAPGGMDKLRGVLRGLKSQIMVAGKDDFLRAFTSRDAAVLVGWTSDVVRVAQGMSDVEVIVPASGSSLWADLWCVPAWADGGDLLDGPSPVLPIFLEYALQPTRAHANRHWGLGRGASPLLLPAQAAQQVEPAKVLDPAVFDSSALASSEFLLPLDADSARLFTDVLNAA